MSATHKAIAATSAGVFSEVQVPTQEPGPGEVLVKVEYAALIPLDVEFGVHGASSFGDPFPYTPGFTASGTVVRLGEGAELSVGDKVAGFAMPQYGSKSKAAQEYIILPWTGLAKIPDNVSLKDAAALPDQFATAWWTLHTDLGLTVPHSAAQRTSSYADIPILVYGAGATSGQAVLQVLAHTGFKRIVAVASRKHEALLRSHGAAHVVDYHDADWPSQAKQLVGGTPFPYAVDIISTDTSLASIATAVASDARVAIVLPIKLGHSKIIAAASERDGGAKWVWELPPHGEKGNPFAAGVKLSYVRTFTYDTDEALKKVLFPKILPALLASGDFKVLPTKLIDTPADSLLDRVRSGIELLSSGSVSGYKVIVKL